MIRVDLPDWDQLGFTGINIHDVIVGRGRTTASPDDDRGLLLAPPPGDVDHDSDVDLIDFGLFQQCLPGTGQPASFRARCDFNRDGNVDLQDYEDFEAWFFGPGV
jgi:hypothetical protein